MRDREVAQEHENVTLDHSFLNNLALLDGFFLSGVGTMESSSISRDELLDFWSRKEAEDFQTGNRHRPYRNHRIIPYLRSGYVKVEDEKFVENSHQREYNWEISGYDDEPEEEKKQNHDQADNSILKFQTLAADVLLDGAFNVNSTSVDAWVSQLSMLAGKKILLADGRIVDLESDQVPFPRNSTMPADMKIREVGSNGNPVLLDPVTNASSNSSAIWNELRVLSPDEIALLAHCIVEQVKLRGPFLSYADFTNQSCSGK